MSDQVRPYSEMSEEIDALKKKIAALEQSEAAHNKETYTFRERMKELQALYRLSEMVAREDVSRKEFYQEYAGIMTESWQYPEIACARIVIGDREFRTDNFRETPWMQSAPVTVHGMVAGKIEVGYLEEKPELAEGPFLKEERRLINAIAERLGRITERRQAQEALRESEKKFRFLTEGITDIMWILDLNLKTTYVSPSVTNVLGFTPEERVLQEPADIMTPESYARAVNALAWELESAREDSADPDRAMTIETEYYHKDGHIVWMESMVHFVRDRDGAPIGIYGVSRDITARKWAENEIQKLLSEKELLLREVHHRIKNNMATMVSVLSLHATSLEDPSCASSLREAKNRLQSMMVLYDKLYRSADFRAVSTTVYLVPLIDEIVGNFPNRGAVTIETEIEDHILDAKTLSPIGIILNELLTNAMKHAFTGRDKGLLRVSFSLKEHHALLSVQDNGIGIPESFDIKTATGFGMQLVDMLTEQLQGTIRIERREGTEFILEFDV